MIYIVAYPPIGNPDNPRGQAQTYCGYCDDDRLEERLAEHRAGRGAAILRAVIEQGKDFRLVLTLPGDRKVERELKRRKNMRRVLAQYGVEL